MSTSDKTDIGTAIDTERARRLALKAKRRPYHYWRERGDNTAPVQEFWCDHCAGFYGVPHDSDTHRGEFCPEMLRSGPFCACIDCTVWRSMPKPRSMARPDPNRFLLPELVEATYDLNQAQARYDAALVAVRAAGYTDVDIISACRAAQ